MFLKTFQTPQSMPRLMTDEGSAYPTVVTYFGWAHVLDRYHFNKQITSSWEDLDEPHIFRDDIIEILDSCTERQYRELMSAAKKKYTTQKALDLLDKIKMYDHNLVYAFTSEGFTSGHISTQRAEGMMSAIKANGVLKQFLRNATYQESLARIRSVARHQDKEARNELIRCRRDGHKVGEKVRASIQMSKIAAMKISRVHKVNQKPIAYEVRGGEGSSEVSLVEFNSPIYWKGREYSITKCSCPYFQSTLLLCPCACAACQRTNVDIDDCSHYHPRFWIGYHPLYHQALANLGVDDFDDPPWVKLSNVGCNQNPSRTHQESMNDIILRNRTQIFNELPNMAKFKACERMVKLRQECDACVKIGMKSATSTKLMLAYVVELRNRLEAENMKEASLCVKMTASERSINRHGNYMDINLANKKNLKRKRTGVKAKKSRSCTTCRDVFHMPASVHVGHRARSSRCPNRNRKISQPVTQEDEEERAKHTSDPKDAKQYNNDKEDESCEEDSTHNNEGDRDGEEKDVVLGDNECECKIGVDEEHDELWSADDESDVVCYDPRLRDEDDDFYQEEDDNVGNGDVVGDEDESQTGVDSEVDETNDGGCSQSENDEQDDDDDESLTNPNNVGDNHDDLYRDDNGPAVVPLEFNQVCSILRQNFVGQTLQQFSGHVVAPILDYLRPKVGMEEAFETWIDRARQTAPTLLAGIGCRNSTDATQINKIVLFHGLGSRGYGIRVLSLCNSYVKVKLLEGKSWPNDIQSFVDVADVQMGGSDYNLQILAYNSVISALEISATNVGAQNFWEV